jgi:hypothetical protein
LAQTRARSFRVAVIIFVVFIVIFFAATFVVFFFLLHFFFGWLVSKETFGSYRPIRRVRVGTFWMYSVHAQWYASSPLANAGISNGSNGAGAILMNLQMSWSKEG